MSVTIDRLISLPQPRLEDICRFWSKVNKEQSCWLWTGSLYDNRYGRFQYCINSKIIACCAHRFSYRIHFEDPVGFLVCHECNNPLCINPEHLLLGNESFNQQYAYQSGRHRQDGENNACAKFTKEEAIKMVKEAKYMTRPELARKYSCHLRTIYNILSGSSNYDIF